MGNLEQSLIEGSLSVHRKHTWATKHLLLIMFFAFLFF